MSLVASGKAYRCGRGENLLGALSFRGVVLDIQGGNHGGVVFGLKCSLTPLLIFGAERAWSFAGIEKPIKRLGLCSLSHFGNPVSTRRWFV